ncbi:MAG: hypothetical protein QOF51_241 [Chloroflexota bacterium]|nr:hypothetical protein [Chloroflexota bacterium]
MTATWYPDIPRDVHALLKHGEVKGLETIPWGSNFTFCAVLDLEGRQGLGVYKPRRGERPLWDFPDGTLYRREYAAYVTSQALGWPFVPATVVRDGPHGVGSMQLWVESEPPRSYRELQDPNDLQLARIAAFDFVTNNADRKAGHVLRDPGGKLWGIDHGLCFNVVPKVRTVLIHLCGSPVPRLVLEELAQFREDTERVEALTTLLAAHLECEEIEVFLKRVDLMLAKGVYPHIEGRRGVPWPPF